MNTKERAILVAEKVHAGQSYDIYPYIYHIKEVVEIAEKLGYDESIVVACFLHDALEDGNLSYNDIKKSFGEEIAEIVYAVTDELGRNRKERKLKTYPKIKNNWKAAAVKICDRIANIKQSKEFNPKMLKCYQEEHDDFKNGIYNINHPQNELKKAWDMLNDISGF